MNAAVMKVKVDLENASTSSQVPSLKDFELWSDAALSETEDKSYLLSIRIVNEEESAELNSHYRNKSGPTNILSFPVAKEIQVGDEDIILGDLAICGPVVEREAIQQNKTLTSHWAHLTVHGVLHLQGYDHESEEDADIMEALEIKVLKTLGFDNPYIPIN